MYEMISESSLLHEESSNSTDNSGPVASYYRDKSIFITGATGFLGKVLIEKLIRSCSDLKVIYVLVRAKKGKKPSDRIDEILNSNGVIYLRTYHRLIDSILYL